MNMMCIETTPLGETEVNPKQDNSQQLYACIVNQQPLLMQVTVQKHCVRNAHHLKHHVGVGCAQYYQIKPCA